MRRTDPLTELDSLLAPLTIPLLALVLALPVALLCLERWAHARRAHAEPIAAAAATKPPAHAPRTLPWWWAAEGLAYAAALAVLLFL